MFKSISQQDIGTQLVKLSAICEGRESDRVKK